MRISDWSSDVCSSDLHVRVLPQSQLRHPALHHARPGDRLVCRRSGTLGGPDDVPGAVRLVQMVRGLGSQHCRAVAHRESPFRTGRLMNTRSTIVRNTLFSSVGIYTEYFLDPKSTRLNSST